MRTLGFSRPNEPIIDRSLLNRFFDFIGLGNARFNREGSQIDLSLKDLSLSRNEQKSLRGDLLADMPSKGSLLHPEADVKEFDLQRSRINEIIASIQSNQSGSRITEGLQKIDPVYLSPTEKGQIVNALLSQSLPQQSPQASIDKVLASLFVSPFSETARAKEFLSQISGEQLGRFREVTRHLEEAPATAIAATDDSAFDGTFIGHRGAAFKHFTSLSKIPPVLPTQTPRSDDKFSNFENKHPLVYINGLNMEAASHAEALQYVADQYGHPVVGVHNAKLPGLSSEFNRAKDDVHNVRRNPTIDTVRDLVLSAVYRNEELILVPISHGTNIASRGIQRAKSILRQEGVSAEQVERDLKRIEVITFAGACWEYPDGPRYKHLVLICDPVPFHFGLTQSVLSKTEIEHTKKLHKKNKGASFKGVAALRRLVGLKIKHPLIHPGRDAEIFVLDKHEQNNLDPHPHSTTSYVLRERSQKLLSFGQLRTAVSP